MHDPVFSVFDREKNGSKLGQSSETTPLLAEADTALPEERNGNAADFPRNRREAVAHIEEIRRQKEKYRGDRMVKGLLKDTREHNSTSSRLLYELLQNANDNDYGSRPPQMYIHYQDGYLLIETNEVGFSKANVESICSATESSKTGDPTRQYVGEKGIGFKSVFMVSSSVWISSGYYSFRFDRDGELGMIMPHWDDAFPFKRRNGFTSILLQIDQSQEVASDNREANVPTRIIQDLAKLDPMDLMFLTKMKQVEIVFPNGKSWSDWITGSAVQNVTLKAGLLPDDHGVLLETMVSRDGIVEPLVAFRYRNKALPSRRTGSSSDLVLVFSRDIPLDRPIATRKTYAFLPLRHYGFKFVVQGDFMLVSSRESIIQHKWNDFIIFYIPNALVQAVAAFRGRYPDLWYRWPMLLPFEDLRDDIFLPLPENIKAVFSQPRIVEDVHGNCFRPCEVHLVPKKFRDADGNPLLPPRYSKNKLLSENYPAKAVKGLREIGVKKLSDELFLSDLAHFINSFAMDFHRMSDSWHSTICKVLFHLLDDHYGAIENLAIIPLRGTRWVSAKFGLLYFGAHANGPTLPGSIDGAGEIDRRIEKTSDRGKLFRALGAKDAKKSVLCDLILREHQNPGFSFFFLEVTEMVSHLEFLYHADWKPEGGNTPDLYCCIPNGEKRQISQVYMESNLRYSASSVPAVVKNKLTFMHPMYRETFARFSGGLEWLEKTLKVRTMLRVAGWRMFRGLTLHGDFESFLTERPLEALELLRHHWTTYSSWFRAPEASLAWGFEHDAPKTLDNDSREKLRCRVAETKVPCHGGHRARLKETYLAKESLLLLCKETSLQHSDAIPSGLCWICEFIRSHLGLSRRQEPQMIVRADRLLEVSHPEQPDWDFLQTFNVITKPGATLYIDHLRRIRGHPVEYKHMADLYAQLENFCYSPDGKRVQDAFKEKESIYVPNLSNPDRGAWYSFDAVVWDGPPCLRHIPRLNMVYGRRSGLFQKVLEKPIADLGTLRTEAEHLVPTDTNHVGEVLHYISDYLGMQSGRAFRETDAFFSCPMFPVHPAGSDGKAIVLKSAVDPWMIPNHPRFRSAFLGVVHLSLFSADDFRRLQALSNRLNLSSRHISKHIKEKRSDPIGDKKREDYAKLIRIKAEFISRLIPPYLGSQIIHEKRQLLETIKVFQSARIETRWTLTVGDEEISSNAVQGRITSRMESDHYNIYIVGEDDLFSIGYTPMELSEELAAFCGIDNEQDSRLLTKFLEQSNPAIIKADLKNRARNQRLQSHVSAVRTSHAPEPTVTIVGTGSNADGKEEVAQGQSLPQDLGQRAADEPVSDTIDNEGPTKLPVTDSPNNPSGIGEETPSSAQMKPAQDPSGSNAQDANGDLKETEGDHREHGVPDPGSVGVSGSELDMNQGGMDELMAQPLPVTSSPGNHDIAGESVSVNGVGDDGQVSQFNEAPAVATAPVLPKVEVNGEAIDTPQGDENTGEPGKSSKIREVMENGRLGAADTPIGKGEDAQMNLPTDAQPEIQADQSLNGATKGPSRKIREQSKDDSTMPLLGDRGRKLSLNVDRDTRSRSAIHIPDSPALARDRKIHTPDSPASTRDWTILPALDGEEIGRYRRPGGPPVEDDFVDMNLGRIMNHTPRMVFMQKDTKDTQYFGELYVARYLSWFLEKKVIRNSDKPAEPRANDEELPLSTFTVKDESGRLRDLLVGQGKVEEAQIDKGCTFYIDVFATNQDADWPFSFSQDLYKKAERLALSRATTATKVHVLARVSKVLTDPGIALYADPWALFRDGLISLEPTGSYHGVISDSAPAMILEKSVSATVSAEMAGIYEDLPVDQTHIRLLKLELSDDDRAPLKAELVQESLDRNLRFWAISYCWGGNPAKCGPFIEVNGLQTPVTESLFQCLHCLRRKKVEALVWADAVCINQDDPVEKAMQVRRMGSLYRLAHRVMVWLGESNTQDYDAMQSLATLHGQPIGSGTILHGSSRQDLRAGQHVNTFLQRAWFTRAWVVQELVFGPQVTVFSGDSELPWDSFIDGIIKCEAHMKRVARLSNSIFLTSMEAALALDRTRKHYKNDSEQNRHARLKYSFLTLVEYFFYTQSTRERDKLFALLNLAWDTSPDHESFKPDYKSDENTILAKYACQFVEAGLALDLMYRAGHDKGAQFCSWIPDLMNQRRRIQYAPSLSTWNAAGLSSGLGFCAGARFPNDAEVRSTTGLRMRSLLMPPVLAIRGTMFDVVQSCRPLSMDGSIQFSKTLTELRRFFSPLRIYPGCSPNWEDELLVGCLIGDAVGPQTATAPVIFASSPSSANPNPEKWPEEFADIVLDVRPDQDARAYLDKPAESRRIIEQFWETSSAFMQLIPQATACITAKKYAGVVPGEARHGDMVFIPHNAKVPFLLRRRPNGQCYELIGECYIHNIMYHEGHASVGLKDEVVCLV